MIQKFRAWFPAPREVDREIYKIGKQSFLRVDRAFPASLEEI